MTEGLTENISRHSVSKRVALARQIGQELTSRKSDQKAYDEAIRLAETLVLDWCQQVREALAFELRNCRKLPKLVACKIACDVDEVAVPFLRVTPALKDNWMAELVPLLSVNAHYALAVRADLGPLAARQIARHCNEKTALALVKNTSIVLTTPFTTTLVDTHDGRVSVMDALSQRQDLPLAVASDIITKISAECRKELCERFGLEETLAEELTSESAYSAIWQQIRHANPAQVHAQAIDMRINNKLTPELALAMAERGSIAFMESALALSAGRTLLDVREILHLADPDKFVRLVQSAGISDQLAPRFLKIAKAHYAAHADKRSVGKPAMWQAPANANSPDEASSGEAISEAGSQPKLH